MGEIDLTFAPIRELPDDEKKRGAWSYEFSTSEKKYEDDQYLLSGNDDRIYLVSTFRPIAANLPPYFWHLISVPKHEGYSGYVSGYKRLKDSGRESRYDNMQESMQDGYLVYVDSRLSEQEIKQVRMAWEEAFGKAMELLVKESYTSAMTTSYMHTFIYVGGPEDASSVMQEGERRHSSKAVQVPGSAFGFVLDDEGKCLAHTSIELK